MKTCIDCNRETERGIFCPKCDAVQTAFAYVASNWTAREMDDLIATLRSASLETLKRERHGAVFLQKLIRYIETKSVPPITPDSVKTALAARLVKYLEHRKTVAAYDAKHGEGAHKKVYNETMDELKASMSAKYETPNQPKQWDTKHTGAVAI